MTTLKDRLPSHFTNVDTKSKGSVWTLSRVTELESRDRRSIRIQKQDCLALLPLPLIAVPCGSQLRDDLKK